MVITMVRTIELWASWFEHSKLFIRTKLKHMNQPIEFNDVHFYVLPFATISEVKNF